MKAVIPAMKQNPVTDTPGVVTTAPAVTRTERVVDWDAVEADYRAGIKTLRQIGADHGCSHVAVARKAQKLEWTRSLAHKIQQKADELVNRALLTNRVPDGVVVDQNAALVATVRIEHRKDISRAKTLALKLMEELESQTFQLEAFANLGEFMRDPDDKGMDKLSEIYQKVMSLPSRTKTMKDLAETLRTMITLEREAFGVLPPVVQEQQDNNPLVKLLQDMRRSSLPVVHEVSDDDI